MSPTSIEHKTKAGKTIKIREAIIEDAQDLLDLKRGYITNTTTLPWTIDEYPPNKSKEEEIIRKYANSLNSILLVAKFENKLIGNIDLTGSERIKMSHTAMLGMGIDRKWRNQGVGSALIKCALDWALQNSNLTIIWLDVYSSNDLGLNLYFNSGFKECGRINNFFKEGDGYIDKIQMVKHLYQK